MAIISVDKIKESNMNIVGYDELTGYPIFQGHSVEYKNGYSDAIDDFYEALTSKRCECCKEFRNECDKYGKCFISEIAEQLKDDNDE